jgi:hypothetical protein
MGEKYGQFSFSDEVHLFFRKSCLYDNYSPFEWVCVHVTLLRGQLVLAQGSYLSEPGILIFPRLTSMARRPAEV